jgi:hypothetical protein
MSSISSCTLVFDGFSLPIAASVMSTDIGLPFPFPFPVGIAALVSEVLAFSIEVEDLDVEVFEVEACEVVLMGHTNTGEKGEAVSLTENVLLKCL